MSGKSPIGTDHKLTIIKYWMEKARESIEAAKGEFTSGRNSIAVRNVYYACFYALSAVLLKEGRSFKKHTAVKAALRKDLIRTGIVDAEWGKFYNRVFDSRHEGDYQPLRTFEVDEVKVFLEQGAIFLAKMEELLLR